MPIAVSERSTGSRTTSRSPASTPSPPSSSGCGSGPRSTRIDAISPTATAKPTACTHSAPEIPTSPISAPPTAGPTRKPSDQTNDSADWPCDEVAAADQLGDGAEGRGVDEHAPGGDHQGGGVDQRDRHVLDGHATGQR